jgi:hypothetical protein
MTVRITPGQGFGSLKRPPANSTRVNKESVTPYD